MPTLPWTTVDDVEPGAALVLGSKLELAHYRRIPAFFIDAMRVRKQVRRSEGAYGVSLIAQLGHKTFWTLSAWKDQESLDAFVRSQPHRDVMTRHRGHMKDSEFTSWSVDPASLPKPDSFAKELWTDAKARLREVAASPSTASG